ncbi:hypothetical protein B296_00008392 [Ensete ventricosum]|uniref:Uncharacterized protein n=1 Tax=Ensete ventricosum TaxID=4639 RepID=A0A427B0M1_ENSVE|nr:hypothetical protein B296_00008392 [Ensete ventricosum]
MNTAPAILHSPSLQSISIDPLTTSCSVCGCRESSSSRAHALTRVCTTTDDFVAAAMADVLRDHIVGGSISQRYSDPTGSALEDLIGSQSDGI